MRWLAGRMNGQTGDCGKHHCRSVLAIVLGLPCVRTCCFDVSRIWVKGLRSAQGTV